jgi:hypothetical protein
VEGIRKISICIILIIIVFTIILIFVPSKQVDAQESSFSTSVDTTVFQNIPNGVVDPAYSVSKWDPSRTWNGTTIFGDSTNEKIVEVNMKGEVVWQYQIPFKAEVMGVMELPNNDILFAVVQPVQNRGAYEVNRDGQIVWQYVNRDVAHDAVRLPNGDTLIEAAHAEDYSSFPYIDPEIVEVDKNGNTVWSFHFSNSQYASDPKYNDIRGTDWGYWTHTNEALRLPDGSTLISPRNFNMIIIVDKDGKVLKTYGDVCSNCKSNSTQNNSGGGMGGIGSGSMGGSTSSSGTQNFAHVSPQVNYFFGQHSPIPLPNGNLLFGEPGPGRAVEFNTTTDKIVWQWPHGGRHSGVWINVRGVERLPNGNTLVSDSNGKIFEVTRKGDIVWELDCTCYNPNGKPDQWPFFQAERVSYMPPTFTVQNPSQDQVYNGTVPFNIVEGKDVRKISYSILYNSNNTWIIQNQTALENNFKDSLDPPTKTFGPNSLTLPNGNYTLRLVSSSTGFGYKDFYTPIRINYVTEDIQFTVQQSQDNQSHTSTPNISTSSVSIPSWVRNNAKWWSEGQVGDSEFVKGMQYLVQQGIITVQATQVSSNPSQGIPSWVKSTAKWWADGHVSDDEFIKAIQYLINNGIIQVR